MTQQEIIAVLRSALSLGGLTFDEQGVCCVFIPGELELQFEWDTDANRLIALALLGDLGDDADGRRSRALLAANFLFSGTRGETLSLEADTQRVFLCAAFSAAGQAADALVAWLEGVVDTAQHWRKRLDERDPALAAPQPWAGSHVKA